MSTESQIAANRRNAEASTGPRTAEGKARVSRNSTTFGLYSTGDVVRPEEESLYRAFCEDFQQQLAPQGAMETTLAAEIVHAAWRLRRCAAAESSLDAQSGLDPMLDPATAAAWNSIDRARTQALRHFQRATAELRRLQTERQARNDEDLNRDLKKDLKPSLSPDVRPQLLPNKLLPNNPTKQTQSDLPETAPIPRGAPCPCGSGAKYKRCCGTNAPAVLSPAA